MKRLVVIMVMLGACNGARITSLQAFDDPYGFGRMFSLTSFARGAAGMPNGAANDAMLDLQMRSKLMQMNHETTMSIIRNMGGGGGTTYDHYENGAYKGTW